MITEKDLADKAKDYLDTLRVVSKNEFNSIPLAFIAGFKQASEMSEWVSVEDRLPIQSNYKEQKVLAVKSDQGHYNYKAMAWYGDNVGDGELDFHVFDDLTCINKFKHTQVTHWMYIPD